MWIYVVTISVFQLLAISKSWAAPHILSYTPQLIHSNDVRTITDRDTIALKHQVIASFYRVNILYLQQVSNLAIQDSISNGFWAVKKMDTKSIGDFFSTLRQKAVSGSKRILSPKAYYNLAIIFAKLKNYPTSLRYFALAGALNENSDISNKKYHFYGDSTELSDLLLPALHHDSTDDKGMITLGNDTIAIENRKKKSEAKSKPISKRAIMAPFRENRSEAEAYGIMIHVKQPSYGKRKQFTFFNNVGHMFVTLIQYLPDNKNVARTFGFYPDKDNPFSATPIMPGTSSTYKNDVDHDWDESIGKFISYKQFKLILNMVSQYSRKKYHLSKNNCTDFGLCISAIAGIDISDTKGSWPLGSGNDPGDAGQSILEGKVKSMDEYSNLFICINDPSH